VSDSVWHDLRFAMRSLHVAPGFALLAILALALGIGSTTTIFSVIQNALLNPFPYKGSDRLVTVRIHDSAESNPGGRYVYSTPEFLAVQDQSQVFEGVIGESGTAEMLTGGGATERVLGGTVTLGTFQFLGMMPFLGRVLAPEDFSSGAPPVFVMRYKTWLTRFGEDPSILNKTFFLNGKPHTLIGIMPPRFALDNRDIWMPVQGFADPHLSGEFFLIARLRPGVTRQQAAADLDGVFKRLARTFPDDYPKRFTVQVMTLAEHMSGAFRYVLMTLVAAVGLLLLIACGNVANLLLTRATTREKEIAIRACLGASRWRLARQLMVESLLLALMSAVAGCLLAWIALKFIPLLIPLDVFPAESMIELNAPVLAFTAALSIVIAFIFGLAPALYASKPQLSESLRDSRRGARSSFAAGALRSTLVVGEVAISLVLLTGAGLLMRSFLRLVNVDLGFDPDRTVATIIPLPEGRYRTADQLSGFLRPLIERVRTVPGVVAAAPVTVAVPFGGSGGSVDISGEVHSEKWERSSASRPRTTSRPWRRTSFAGDPSLRRK
jgi:putative ABC transport system permease protein